MLRLLTPLAALLLAAAPAVAQPAVAPPPHLPIDELVKVYQSFGLPLPPKDAELVRLTPTHFPPRLGFRCQPAKPGETPRYFVGTGYDYSAAYYGTKVEPVSPTPEALAGIEPTCSSDLLALAVQCRLRGWNDLATALNSKAAEAINGREVVVTEGIFGFPGLAGRPYRSSSVPGLRSENLVLRSVVEELRLAASDYWSSRIMWKEDSNRHEILKYLKLVEPGSPSIRDLELTLAPSNSEPGSVEALIDDLRDYSSWSDQVSKGVYWSIAEKGFDAVPALLKHVSDQRLSRSHGISYTSGFLGGTTFFDARIGHLASWLLDDLSDREIAGSYRGLMMVDPRKAEVWWAKARKIGEEKWLVEHALPRTETYPEQVWINGEPPLPGPNAVIFRALGAKYPNRLAEVYETVLRKRTKLESDDLAAAIGASKLPREKKIALLGEGASHRQFIHRYAALSALADLDDALFRKHLLTTLKWVSLDRECDSIWPEDICPEVKLVDLVHRTDDGVCWEALADTVRRAPVTSRVEFLSRFDWQTIPAKQERRRERLRFLLSFLDDRSFSRTEVRDVAAGQLASILGTAINYDPNAGPLTRLALRDVIRRAAERELAKPQN
jgi:hypothetical protein